MDIAIKKNNYKKSGHFNVRGQKYTLFYYLVISVVYISGFEQLIRGVFRNISPPLELPIVLFIHFVVFIIPLTICWYGSVDKRFVVVLLLILFITLLFPVRKFGNVVTYFFGFKLYFGCLLYIPILKYLSKDSRFENNFMKHFIILAGIYSAWVFVEMVTTVYYPDIALMMKSFSPKVKFQWMLGRPIGLSLDLQTGAFVVACLSLISFLKKRYIWTLVLFSLSLLINMRTWAAALIMVLGMLLLLRINTKLLFSLALFIPVCIKFPSLLSIGHYKNVFMFKNPSWVIIWDTFLKDGWFLITDGGLFPNGFIKLYRSTVFNIPDLNVPIEIWRNEVALLRVHYQMGAIATVVWLGIFYAPFLKKPFTFYKNDYMILLLFSSIGFIHHLTILKPFILLFLLFCGIQAEKNTGKVTIDDKMIRGSKRIKHKFAHKRACPY